MAKLNIISAGAAQSVVLQLVDAYGVATGHEISATYGAVGAQKAKLLSGAPCDLIILSAQMIDELIAAGVVTGRRYDLGKTGGGIAVRAGTPWPDVSNSRVLVGNLLAAEEIFFPDPTLASAGIHFVKTLDAFGVRSKLEPRFRTYPNGSAAMHALAQSKGPLRIGMTMVTEIKLASGVELVGQLPAAMQLSMTYSMGICTRAGQPELARDFVRRLTSVGARPLLREAGFEVD